VASLDVRLDERDLDSVGKTARSDAGGRGRAAR